jgi:peptide/nickel transport system ATP-binding protein
LQSDVGPELLSVSVSVDYPQRPGVLRDVELSIMPAEILGLVGTSGCGKSTLSLAILQLLSFKRGKARGQILFDGRDLMQLGEREMRSIRGREIGLVLQSPLSALNPVMRIGTQLREAWKVHKSTSRDSCQSAIESSLASVSLPTDREFLRRYPAQLSVGQAQRVLIAMAILHRPKLLIADEPTSALDPITQVEIIELFRRLNKEMRMAMLYISHDLLSIASICNRIAILRQGELVECGTVQQVFENPQHPYTKLLIDALPAHPNVPKTIA